MAMLIAAALIIAAAAAPQSAAADPPAQPAPPSHGVQAVARATVEILTVARAEAEAGPGEPQRKLRRQTDGRTAVEFE
jgi:hypothetical protein